MNKLPENSSLTARSRSRRRTPRCGYCRLKGHDTKACVVKQEMTAKIAELFPSFERIVSYLAVAVGVERGACYKSDQHRVGGVFLGELDIRVDNVVNLCKWGKNDTAWVRASYMDYTGTKRWMVMHSDKEIDEALSSLTPEQKEKADKFKVSITYTNSEVINELSAWSAEDVDINIGKILSLL